AEKSARKINRQPSRTRRAHATVWRTCFAVTPPARSDDSHSAKCSAKGRRLCSSKGSERFAFLNSALFTIAASICPAGTLFGESVTAFTLPARRPFHFFHFFLPFCAPAVPLGTRRAFKKRAPGVSLRQGLPSGPIQQL